MRIFPSGREAPSLYLRRHHPEAPPSALRAVYPFMPPQQPKEPSAPPSSHQWILTLASVLANLMGVKWHLTVLICVSLVFCCCLLDSQAVFSMNSLNRALVHFLCWALCLSLWICRRIMLSSWQSFMGYRNCR